MNLNICAIVLSRITQKVEKQISVWVVWGGDCNPAGSKSNLRVYLKRKNFIQIIHRINSIFIRKT
jgi:hypothetical protein